MTGGSFVAAARRVAAVLLFAVAPLALTAAVLGFALNDDYAFDFRQFWQGGRDVLDGVSPYATAGAVERVPDLRSLTPEQIQEVFRFPYPAAAALAVVPLALLPFPVAAGVLTVLLLACVGLALWILGVRDWRAYGAAFAAFPVIGSVRLGAFTPALVLALAVTWRYRERRWIAGAALAVAVVLKIFLWPLAVWLVATGRRGAALVAAGLSVGATLGSWAVLGFAGLADYPAVLSALSEAVQDKGYSVVALALALDLGAGAGRVAAAVAGGASLVAAVLLGRRGDELAAFGAALAAALLLTPIVWVHYFALLLVPIAIARPRLSPLWLLPLAFWATPVYEADGAVWRIVLAAGIAAASLVLAARTAPANDATGGRRARTVRRPRSAATGGSA